MKIIYKPSKADSHDSGVSFNVFIQPNGGDEVQILSEERIGADDYTGFDVETKEALKQLFPNMYDIELSELESGIALFYTHISLKESVFWKEKRPEKLSTQEYIEKNRLTFFSALNFTNNDLDFMDKEGIKELHINKGKPSYEILSRTDVMERIVELYRLSVRGIPSTAEIEAIDYDAVKVKKGR